MQVVVLAAGRGTRLRPVTADRSKAMVPVLGRPLIELAIEPFVAAGLSGLIVVAGPGDDELRSVVDGWTRSGLAAEVVVQEQRLGMGHALSMASPLIRGDFAVTACDSLVSADHVRGMVRAHSEGAGVLSLMDVDPELVARSAAVGLAGDRVTGIVEKPAPGEAPSNTVSLPHYILPKPILDLLGGLAASPRGELELQDAIQGLIDAGHRVAGVRTAERRQVSSPGDLLRLNLDELRATGGMDLPVRWLDARVEGPVVVDRGARIGHDCVIGPNVFLEDGCVVGNEVAIRNSVVLRNTWVPTCSEIDGELIA